MQEFQDNYVSVVHFFFKQRTAYEMRISDWSSDVCSSDLNWPADPFPHARHQRHRRGQRARRDRVGLRSRRRRARLHGTATCRDSVCQYVEISVVVSTLISKYSTTAVIITLTITMFTTISINTSHKLCKPSHIKKTH